jgi:hypothetical protein
MIMAAKATLPASSGNWECPTRSQDPNQARRKARSPTALVPARHDVVEQFWILINRRVDELHGTLPNIQPRGVDEGHDTSENRRATTCSIDKGEVTVDSDHVVYAVGGDIRDTTGSFRGVVAIGSVGRPYDAKQTIFQKEIAACKWIFKE